MEIYAKSAFSIKNMIVKQQIGCDAIEVQLLDELFKIGGYNSIHQIFDLDQFKDMPISVIHSPILYGKRAIALEQLCDSKDLFLFYNIFELAEYFGKIQNKDIIVIIHSETCLKALSEIGNMLYNIVKNVDKLLLMFPHVKLAIENVTPLRNFDKGPQLCNNFYDDNVILVDYLKKELQTDRIGTVLDTCHAMISEKYISVLYDALGEEKPDFSLDYYFDRNKEDIMLIHLADFKGNGYGSGNHGTPFEDKQKCFDILDLYKKYNYSCPITLEVCETDFLVSDNYRKQKLMVDEYLQGGN